jgi:glycosyltransferase involved in cell wall biosynthesis
MPRTDNKILSTIIPCYNERATIEEIVRRVFQVELPLEKGLILVDDCSTDGTADILASLEGRYERMQVLWHSTNRGKGAAIRTALRYVSGSIIVIQDADLEYDPADYPALLQPILDSRADAVYGSRFLGPHRAFLFTHYLGNRLLTLLTNALYNTILTDMETGSKAFCAEVLLNIPLRSKRFDFEPEVTTIVLWTEKLIVRRCMTDDCF